MKKIVASIAFIGTIAMADMVGGELNLGYY